MGPVLLWWTIKYDSDFPEKRSRLFCWKIALWLTLFVFFNICRILRKSLKKTEDCGDYNPSVQLIDSLVTPPMFLVSSWMDSRVKTPAKSLQAWAFSLGKPLLPATSSHSPSHAISPGPNSQSISRPYWGCFVASPPPPLLVMSWQKTQTEIWWAGKSHSSL